MWYRSESNKIIATLYVQPGAKSTEIVGMHGEALKIRLKAPPLEGRANEALIKFVAQLFQVPTRQVKLIRGEKNRKKTLEITGSLIQPLSLFK